MVVEISPLVSLHGEGLEKLKGCTLQSPVLINSLADLESLSKQS